MKTEQAKIFMQHRRIMPPIYDIPLTPDEEKVDGNASSLYLTHRNNINSPLHFIIGYFDSAIFRFSHTKFLYIRFLPYICNVLTPKPS